MSYCVGFNSNNNDILKVKKFNGGNHEYIYNTYIILFLTATWS